MEKNCSSCEFNFGGICTGESENYGKKITEKIVTCDDWSANLAYFTYDINNAPRFIREQFKDCKITYDKLSKWSADYKNGEKIQINLFDAIKLTFGLSIVDIAVLLDVSLGVVYNAKCKGIPKKRVKDFSKLLGVGEATLLDTSTNDFSTLRVAAELFWKRPQIKEEINKMPVWKAELAEDISNTYLHCPIHMAKEFARIDKMHWDPSVLIDEYTECERKLIRYLSRKGKQVEFVEYVLDAAAKIHLKYSVKNECEIEDED